jgi:hypothetical protein
MDRFDRSSEYSTYGVQSSTTTSANLNLSGFEDFSALSDPTLYEAASFSGHSYTPTYATPDIGNLSGYLSSAQHNLSSGPLRSPHGTYLLFCLTQRRSILPQGSRFNFRHATAAFPSLIGLPSLERGMGVFSFFIRMDLLSISGHSLVTSYSLFSRDG